VVLDDAGSLLADLALLGDGNPVDYLLWLVVRVTPVTDVTVSISDIILVPDDDGLLDLPEAGGMKLLLGVLLYLVLGDSVG